VSDRDPTRVGPADRPGQVERGGGGARGGAGPKAERGGRSPVFFEVVLFFSCVCVCRPSTKNQHTYKNELSAKQQRACSQIFSSPGPVDGDILNNNISWSLTGNRH
jgi:hypothetical protein